MNTSLVSGSINDGKRWIKSHLGHINPIPKGLHVDLSSDTMKEATHIITEVMKGDAFRKVYGAKFRLTPIMPRELLSQTKEEIHTIQVQHKHTLD